MNLKTLLPLLAVLACPTVAWTADPPEKWMVIEDSVNTGSSFMLRVDVDQADRTYRVGEHMRVAAVAEKDCYLYLFYYGAGEQVACLFPNKYQTDNRIRAGEQVIVPSEQATFQFTAAPPCGTEILQVVATLEPLDLLADKDLTRQGVTPLKLNDVKEMVVELKKEAPRDWAEARVQITTTEEQGASTSGKRYGVCVGISEFKSERVPPLRVSHLDAEHMAKALKQYCGVEDVTLLTNAQATRANIEQAIFRDLVAKSKPGDTVFIFFSCHGGRASDTNGDEQDGVDEYLVPHDGDLGQVDTVILDDVFARWMQELDGRQVAIILDNCYAGGSAKGAKGVARTPAATGPVDFLDGELRRTKDLGQAGTMILAACQANQVAWEMPTEGDGSVLTHYIVTATADAKTDTNGDGHISLGELYTAIKGPVQDYVRQTFDAEQTPVLLDNAGNAILYRP